MEWEQCTKYTKANKYEWEEDVLNICRYHIVVGNLKDVHCRSTIEEINTYKTENDKGRTSHKHQGELHRSILLIARSPETNEKVHRNQCYLIEHEHGKEVDADEETIYTCRKEHKPHEELLGKWLELP